MIRRAAGIAWSICCASGYSASPWREPALRPAERDRGEDLNDHGTLRRDPAWQTAIERDRVLASPPTLCRFENRADRATAWAIHEVLVEQFIASFASPPAELILDAACPPAREAGPGGCHR